MSMDNNIAPNGVKNTSAYVPYRATKLWNEVVKVLREGLPLGRHRRHMKSFESCFVASDAVSWLHQQLMANPNFGPQVTRSQTVQLLQKFQKANMFVDVRGPKHEKAEFIDNGRLFRFKENSPVKAEADDKMPARTPLATRSALMNSDSALTAKPPIKPKLELERGHSIACLTHDEILKIQAPKTDAPQRKNRRVLPKRSQSCRRERELAENPAQDVQLTESEVGEIWKEALLDSLRTILQLKSIEEVIDPDSVEPKHVVHNMTQINKNGLVTNIDKKDQLPHWIISAMRCLAYWPDKVEENLPDYPGFENDVYKVIKDYFWALDEPLVTHQLYEAFLSVMVYTDNIGKPSKQSKPVITSHNLPSMTSVENLLMNMTNQDNIGPDDVLIFNDPDVTILPGCLTPHNAARVIPWGRQTSASSFPQTRMETSFGINTDEPYTRLYQKQSPMKDYGYCSSQEMESSGAHEQYKKLSRSLQRPYSVCTLDDVFSKSPMELVNEYLKSQRCGSSSDVGVDGHMNGRINSWTSIQSGLQSDELPGLSGHSRSQTVRGSGSRPPPHPNYYAPPPPYTQNPPPYVPPPSYKSVCSRPPPHPLQRRTSNTRLSRGSNMSLHHSFSPSEVASYSLDLSRSLPSLTNDGDPAPGSVLTESYRQAMDSAGPVSTPIGRSLFGNSQKKLQRSTSSPSVLTPLSRNRMNDVLQLCCLLIPPANRRKLHLLLRFMNKASNNNRLLIDNNPATRDLVIRTFTRCILQCEDEVDQEEILAQQIVTFMVDGYVDIMKIPDRLKDKVDDKVAELRRLKIIQAWDDSDEGLSDGDGADDSVDLVESPFVAYCQQVSLEEYEQQRLSSSQMALNTLLDDIINNQTMNQRDKKRHLKQFQKNHPEIYSKRFPNSETEAAIFEKTKSKSQLLSKPLQKLKNLRI